MQNLLYTTILSLSLFLTGFGIVNAEAIPSFYVDYTINKDGTVDVVETITYDFEEAYRHGIFRDLEKKHPQEPEAWYKVRSVDISIDSVRRDGIGEPYTVADTSDNLQIKIGDANRTITGPHTYLITYKLKGALSYGSDGAEFYWNVIGNNWPTSVRYVSATVSGEEEGIVAGKATCYEGVINSKDLCSQIERTDGKLIFDSNNLAPGEGLTIATEVNANAVAYLSNEHVSYLPLGFILGVIWLLYFGRAVYRQRVEGRIDKPVIAQYEPVPNYLPMYTGVLYDGRLDPNDITAGIVYLAEQGFLKIRKTNEKVLWLFNTTDYEVTLLRSVSEIPTEFLRTLSGLLFTIHDIPPKAVMLSSLVANRRVANSALITLLEVSIKADLKANGIMTNTRPPWSSEKTVVAVLLILFLSFFAFVYNGILVILTVAIPTLILGVITFADRRTTKGYEIKNHLEGFKLFLSVTDKERFDFHNAPEKSPELFMKYLPYAIALKVEEKWAAVFAGITIPQPDWYDGAGIASFSTTEFTSGISAFSNNFSASSGTSGSSGGGSSGGGGGGGGGGSW